MAIHFFAVNCTSTRDVARYNIVTLTCHQTLRVIKTTHQFRVREFQWQRVFCRAIYPQGYIAWYNIRQLPRLAFDHKKIIDVAIRRLRGKLTYEPVGFELLDKEFPFSDLVKLYQTFLDKELDRRNFRKEADAAWRCGGTRPDRTTRYGKARPSIQIQPQEIP